MAIGNSSNGNVRGEIEIRSKIYRTLQYGSLVSSGSMAFIQDLCLKAFYGLHYILHINYNTIMAMPIK